MEYDYGEATLKLMAAEPWSSMMQVKLETPYYADWTATFGAPAENPTSRPALHNVPLASNKNLEPKGFFESLAKSEAFSACTRLESPKKNLLHIS